MSGKFPCRSCALPITKQDLSDALLSFTSAQSQSSIVAAFEDIAICIGTNITFESPPYNYKERREDKEDLWKISNIEKVRTYGKFQISQFYRNFEFATVFFSIPKIFNHVLTYGFMACFRPLLFKWIFSQHENL